MNDTGPEDKACCWREQPMQNNNASNWFVSNTRALGINEIMNKITSPKGVLMRTGLITTTSPFLFILFICIPTKKTINTTLVPRSGSMTRPCAEIRGVRFDGVSFPLNSCWTCWLSVWCKPEIPNVRKCVRLYRRRFRYERDPCRSYSVYLRFK